MSNDAIRARCEGLVHEALRQTFRGPMVVSLKSVNARHEEMRLEFQARIGKWTNSAIDQMGESVLPEPAEIDELRLCVHELVRLAPELSISGDEDAMRVWMNTLDRARGLL